MNEASNFCVGPCYQRQIPDVPVKSKLKYTPTGRNLEVQSMPLDTVHTDGNIQLDTHSLYGIQEIKVTHEWFQKQNKRTFIIERSSFAGMGKWASRWLGDNFSEVKFMQLSVSGIMQMNMFGIPLVGADICGFLGNTNENLCTKWHFVGAFYPFSRNHNGG
jgi:alpha-glucosidase